MKLVEEAEKLLKKKKIGKEQNADNFHILCLHIRLV